ncbi:NAD(+) diphosphatase [Microvirga antarctica]|uniref:NAD(+) diphosphatase n=1 Tax=Microvirga antarctica TaxID=2819233 RepID=UPI001B307C29|nr:NAD(+) diphosphatase [Microvirga antarctica]
MNTPLGFVKNSLARHSAERDSDALDRYRDNPRSAVVLIAGGLPILIAGRPGTCLLAPSVVEQLQSHDEQVYLGTLDGQPVVATGAPAQAADLFRNDPAYTVTDLRSIASTGLVPEGEVGLLAMAKSMLDWHARHRFCANCGSRTMVEHAGFRRDCPQCEAQHFPRTDPVVIMLITRGDTCLLGRSARFQSRTYSCLAGFLEPGETIEDAVRRETFEEAGIRVGAVSYLASQPWPFPSSLMIGCVGEAEDDEIVIDTTELEDVRWFTRDDVRRMLDGTHPEYAAPAPVAIAHHLLLAWMRT